MTQYGPKIIRVDVPSIVDEFPSLEKKRTITINDAPRAGQTWAISNTFYDFPEANKTPFSAVFIEPIKSTITIILRIGGVQVAKQILIETDKRSEENSKFNLVGSLEPIVPAIVYPGQGIEIEFQLLKETTSGFLETGQGKLVINYTLNTP